MEAFAIEAAMQLTAETMAGAEIPFELVETAGRPRGRVPLYCYRPLTGTFIRERLGLLSAMPTYAPAIRSLTGLDRVEAYLRQRGETRVPTERRECADAALRAFLSAVFAERSEFGFDPDRFAAAYRELEGALYEGRAVTAVVAPVLGLALDPETRELALGEGLSLLAGDVLDDAPPEAVWGDGEEPHVLIVLTAAQERAAPAPVSVARARFRRTLTALRLFERGGYALGPVAWTRIDAGAWRSVPLGGSGRPRPAAPDRAGAGGRAARLLQPGGAADAAQRGGRVGPGPVRDGLRAPGAVRGADRLPAGAAGPARARGSGQWAAVRPPGRDLRRA